MYCMDCLSLLPLHPTCKLRQFHRCVYPCLVQGPSVVLGKNMESRDVVGTLLEFQQQTRPQHRHTWRCSQHLCMFQLRILGQVHTILFHFMLVKDDGCVSSHLEQVANVRHIHHHPYPFTSPILRWQTPLRVESLLLDRKGARPQTIFRTLLFRALQSERRFRVRQDDHVMREMKWKDVCDPESETVHHFSRPHSDNQRTQEMLFTHDSRTISHVKMRSREWKRMMAEVPFNIFDDDFDYRARESTSDDGCIQTKHGGQKLEFNISATQNMMKFTSGLQMKSWVVVIEHVFPLSESCPCGGSVLGNLLRVLESGTPCKEHAWSQENTQTLT